MPGAEMIMILRRPIMSMYFNAKSVKMKFVPETMRPTAVGWSKPISLNSVADRQARQLDVHTTGGSSLPL